MSTTDNHPTTAEEATMPDHDTTTENPAAELQDDVPQDAQDTDAPREGGGNSEAAKWRRRLRDAEAERDALTERLTGLQRAEAERLAGEHIVKGAALWATGIDVADVLDEAGQVDPEKVAAFSAQARDSLGVEAPRRRPRPNPAQYEDGLAVTPNGDARMAGLIAGR